MFLGGAVSGAGQGAQLHSPQGPRQGEGRGERSRAGLGGQPRSGRAWERGWGRDLGPVRRPRGVPSGWGGARPRPLSSLKTAGRGTDDPATEPGAAQSDAEDWGASGRLLSLHLRAKKKKKRAEAAGEKWVGEALRQTTSKVSLRPQFPEPARGSFLGTSDRSGREGKLVVD